MYPSIGSHRSLDPPTQPAATHDPSRGTSSSGPSYYPTVGTSSHSSNNLGPRSPTALLHGGATAQHSNPFNGVSQQSPLVRVCIAEEFRTHHPVLISPGMDSIPRAPTNFDFDLERRLIADDSRSVTTTASQASQHFDDPFRMAVESFLALGYEREEVVLALATHGSSASRDQVLAFCKQYRQLKSMGFAPAHIMGALVLHNDDIAAATESCLSCLS